jgi:hypothetical protein
MPTKSARRSRARCSPRSSSGSSAGRCGHSPAGNPPIATTGNSRPLAAGHEGGVDAFGAEAVSDSRPLLLAGAEHGTARQAQPEHPGRRRKVPCNQSELVLRRARPSKHRKRPAVHVGPLVLALGLADHSVRKVGFIVSGQAEPTMVAFSPLGRLRMSDFGALGAFGTPHWSPGGQSRHINSQGSRPPRVFCDAGFVTPPLVPVTKLLPGASSQALPLLVPETRTRPSSLSSRNSL